MFRKVDGSSSGGVDNNACNRAALGRRQRGFSVIHLLCGTNCDVLSSSSLHTERGTKGGVVAGHGCFACAGQL